LIDYHTFLIVSHLLGVVIGMGGAFASDFIFLSSVRDERVTLTELRFLRLGGRMVWSGLFLIFISGLFLFATDPVGYIESAKFLSKMTIVSIIFLNGLVFHLIHIPRFHRHASQHFPSSDEFMRAVPLLIVGGAVSSVSWLSAFVLGAWRGIPFGYAEIMSTYLIILGLGIAFGLLMKKKFIPHSR
jgi:hypothetical protein